MVRSEWLFMGVFIAVLLWLQWSALQNWLNVLAPSVTYQHCYIVPFISAWLIWLQRDSLRYKLTVMPACALGAVAYGINRIGHYYAISIMQHTTLWLSGLAVLIFCLGWSQCWQLRRALLFLGFMVPFGDFLIAPLQNIYSVLVPAFLNIFGAQIVQEEHFFYTKTAGIFEVAEACAGLRFLITNLMIGSLFAYFKLSRIRQVILFAMVCIVVPLVGNFLRICIILVIAIASDAKYGASFDHIFYGWGMFVILMLINLQIGQRIACRP